MVEFSKETADRILILEVEKLSLSNQQERFRLVIRLIPHMLNLFLLDASDEVIASAFPVADSGEAGKTSIGPFPPSANTEWTISPNPNLSVFLPGLTATQVGLDPATTARVSEGKESHRPEHSSPWTSTHWPRYQGLLQLSDTNCSSGDAEQLNLCGPSFSHSAVAFQMDLSVLGFTLSQTLCPNRQIQWKSALWAIIHMYASPIPLEHLASYRHKIFPTMNELAAELFQNSRALGPVQRKAQTLKSQLMAALKKKLRLKKGLEKTCRRIWDMAFFKNIPIFFMRNPIRHRKEVSNDDSGFV